MKTRTSISAAFLAATVSLILFGMPFTVAVAQPVAFREHSYELISIPAGITAFDAGSQAYGRGGYLVNVNSGAENGFLVSTFANSSPDRVWLSGISRAEEGPGGAVFFVWSNGQGDFVSYSNWAPGEPNDFSPPTWSVGVEMSLQNGGTWFDRPVSAVSFGYIVEYNVVPEPSTWMLLVLGGLGLFTLRTCRKRRRILR